MTQHLRICAIIGAVSAGLVLLLFASGLLATPDHFLYKAYSLKQKSLTSLPHVSLALALLFALAIAWTTVDITTRPRRIIVVLTALVACLVASWVLSLYSVFVSPFLSCIAILASFILGEIFAGTRMGQKKSRVENLFGRRLSQSQINRIVDSNQSGLFPGSMIEGTVVVVSVQNYMELIETMTPEAYVSMTNFYFQSISAFLVETGGYLEQCDGGSMRILFGAPVPDPKHAVKACRTALDLMKRLDIMNLESSSQWQWHMDFRIGMHSGMMIAATFGSNRLQGFSISGNIPEFARKLCAACSIYGARIIASGDTLEQSFDSCEVRPVELMHLRKGDKSLELYEILAPKHGLSPERTRSRDHFWKGVIYFREKKFDQAHEEFSLARIKGIPDPVLDHYVERIERTLRNKDTDTDSPIADFS